MSRIQTTFLSLMRSKKKALITFIIAGDPIPNLTVPLLHALVAGGADILELGVPFSDPLAEGPVIQRACERALKFNINMYHILEYVKEFRKTNNVTPVVLMGYANPLERFGVNTFVLAAKQAGIDGTIIVDYPPEACKVFVQKMLAEELDPIFLLAPTSSEKRIKLISEISSGFVYYISLKGVTGASYINVDEVVNRIQLVRKYIKLPISVGFGIHDHTIAKAISLVADAIVIGSRLIEELEHSLQENVIQVAQDFVRKIRQTIDS